MNITLFNMGKTDIPYLQEGIKDYYERIGHFIDFKIVDLTNVKPGSKTQPEIIKRREGEVFAKAFAKQDIIILLDEGGKEMNSRKFAEWFKTIQDESYRNIAFVSGGAFGFSENILKLAKHRISLSKMTYTHQMVRLIFMEQLYRACTILKNMKYHND